MQSVSAVANRPGVKLPVTSAGWPMRLGPTKPPTLPTELIRAMPPAAATPLRNDVGTVQKTGSMLMIPDCARARPRRLNAEESDKAYKVKPQAATAAGRA